MIKSAYATKFTREHMAGVKNPTNEPHVNLKKDERELRRMNWIKREAKKNSAPSVIID